MADNRKTKKAASDVVTTGDLRGDLRVWRDMAMGTYEEQKFEWLREHLAAWLARMQGEFEYVERELGDTESELARAVGEKFRTELLSACYDTINRLMNCRPKYVPEFLRVAPHYSVKPKSRQS